MHSTRLSTSLSIETPTVGSAAVLVRIYPFVELGQTIDVTRHYMLVGRDEASTIAIDDKSVSRQHAMIEWIGNCHVVFDMGSTNGTFVNERRIDSMALKAGDRIRFGNQIFKYLTAEDIESQYHEVVFKMMTTDGLTQVYNKRYFLENLERELQQSYRDASPLCVMMIDLDRFKSVNDTYGHLAGDAVLMEFAKRVTSVLRSGELFARYGGEEFAIVCSRTKLVEAVESAERVRAVVSASPCHFEKQAIPITVSIGVACNSDESQRDAQTLFGAADECLYLAKKLGRNQVQWTPRPLTQVGREC